MEENKKYIDEIYHFKGKWEMPSLCGLRIRRKADETLVILTELYEENPGSSVTGMVEAIATEVVRNYNIDPDTAVFIVHNPERGSKYEFFAESFYQAVMKWDGNAYKSLKWLKVPKITTFT